MIRLILILTITFISCFQASADEYKISASTMLQLTIPEGWQLAVEPPPKLLQEMAEHISHDAAEKGYSPTKDQLLDAAQKRLTANEILLYNPQTMANMSIDFSPLRQGEREPSSKSIKLSAKYAGESLEQEEGVSQLNGNSFETQINGARHAYRYDANYLHHEEKMAFSGIIGFAAPYWFYFYYTDYLHAPADADRAQQVFDSIQIINK